MTFAVVFAPEALDQILRLRAYLETAADVRVAADYVGAIVDHCEGLGLFPHAGSPRDDVRSGLRTTSFKKRVVIAYATDDDAETLVVLGVFYGGQDFESLLSEPSP